MKHDKQWYVEQHRAMWNWIADRILYNQTKQHIASLKLDYLQGTDISPHPLCHCFSCEYDSNMNGCCERCLFEWGTKSHSGSQCIDGYYGKCVNATTWQEQAEIARMIANLPVREEV